MPSNNRHIRITPDQLLPNFRKPLGSWRKTATGEFHQTNFDGFGDDGDVARVKGELEDHGGTDRAFEHDNEEHLFETELQIDLKKSHMYAELKTMQLGLSKIVQNLLSYLRGMFKRVQAINKELLRYIWRLAGNDFYTTNAWITKLRAELNREMTDILDGIRNDLNQVWPSVTAHFEQHPIRVNSPDPGGTLTAGQMTMTFSVIASPDFANAYTFQVNFNIGGNIWHTIEADASGVQALIRGNNFWVTPCLTQGYDDGPVLPPTGPDDTLNTRHLTIWGTTKVAGKEYYFDIAIYKGAVTLNPTGPNSFGQPYNFDWIFSAQLTEYDTYQWINATKPVFKLELGDLTIDASNVPDGQYIPKYNLLDNDTHLNDYNALPNMSEYPDISDMKQWLKKEPDNKVDNYGTMPVEFPFTGGKWNNMPDEGALPNSDEYGYTIDNSLADGYQPDPAWTVAPPPVQHRVAIDTCKILIEYIRESEYKAVDKRYQYTLKCLGGNIKIESARYTFIAGNTALINWTMGLKDGSTKTQSYLDIDFRKVDWAETTFNGEIIRIYFLYATESALIVRYKESNL